MQRGETLEEEIRRQGMLDPSSFWWVCPHGRAHQDRLWPLGGGFTVSFSFQMTQIQRLCIRPFVSL